MRMYAVFAASYGHRAIDPGTVLCAGHLDQALRIHADGLWELIENPYDAADLTCVVCGITG